MIRPGDMFCIPFPFEDDIFKSKKRPVVVLRDEGNGLFLVAPITGSNLSAFKRGIWVERNSPEGRKMNLAKDSFIVVDKKMKWPSFGLMEYWGHCPIVDKLLALL